MCSTGRFQEFVEDPGPYPCGWVGQRSRQFRAQLWPDLVYDPSLFSLWLPGKRNRIPVG